MDIERFEGAAGIQKLFKRTLKNDEKVLRTLLVDRPLVYLAGGEFSEEYMTKRSKAKIFLKSLRLSSNDLDLPQHKDYSKYNKEVKVAPKSFILDKSLVIWDDCVAIVNATTISCVLIKNAENASAMKKWFDYVWDHSE